jgi:hypothetical protein
MSRREDIDNAIWSDPDFEALSANATLLYLWSFTNLRCGMAGLYKTSMRTMTESKVPLQDLPDTLAELEATSFAFYEDSVLWVRTRVKHLRSRSPQMARAVANDVLKITSAHPLRARFLEEYGSDPWLRDTLEIPYAEGIGNLSENPVGKGDLDTLSGPSREGPGQRQGQGQGQEPSSTNEQRVFDAWLDSTGKTTRTMFDEKRRRVIRRALKSYPVVDLTDAVKGWRHSPYHRGENETGTVYNDIELLLRDAKRIEQFRDLERGCPGIVVPVRDPALVRSDAYLDAPEYQGAT